MANFRFPIDVTADNPDLTEIMWAVSRISTGKEESSTLQFTVNARDAGVRKCSLSVLCTMIVLTVQKGSTAVQFYGTVTLQNQLATVEGTYNLESGGGHLEVAYEQP